MSQNIDLIKNYNPDSAFALRSNRVITQRAFLCDIFRVLPSLDDAPVINACEDRYHFIVGFGAAILAGAVTLLPPARTCTAIDELSAGHSMIWYLHDGVVPDDIASIPALKFVDVSACLETAGIETIPKIIPAIDPAQHIVTAFTSGSTGKPASNIKHWVTLVKTAALLNDRLLKPITGDVQKLPVVATVPAQHMYGLEMSIMSVLHGSAILIPEKPFYPADIKATCEGLDTPAILVTTPVHLRAIAGSRVFIENVASIVSATAPLSRELSVEIEDSCDCPVMEIYGFTEAGSAATRRTNQSSIWQMLDGMSLQKRQNDYVIVADHLPGQVVSVGDLLAVVSASEFKFIGRSGDALNVAGKRHTISGLAEQIHSIEDVDDVHVFVLDPAQADGRPAALVVSSLEKDVLIKRMATVIDSVFIPRPLIFVESIPRNETGKVPREQLLAHTRGFADD